jgi:hypothetical protein
MATRPDTLQSLRSFQHSSASVWTMWQYRPDASRSLRRIRFSFTDTNMGRQLHTSGRQVYTVWTPSLIRQDVEKNCNRPDASPYYGNCMQQRCNRSNARATLSGNGLIQERFLALYGKPVAQFTIRTASACVQMLPRENRIRVDLGLL